MKSVMRGKRGPHPTLQGLSGSRSTGTPRSLTRQLGPEAGEAGPTLALPASPVAGDWAPGEGLGGGWVLRCEWLKSSAHATCARMFADRRRRGRALGVQEAQITAEGQGAGCSSGLTRSF